VVSVAHRLALLHGVVEVIEAHCETRLAAQHVVAHHRGGLPAALPQRARQRRDAVRERGEVAHQAELERVAAREQAGDRGKGERRRRVGGVEDDAPRRQGVQMRGERALASVAAEPVSAQRVDADQQQARDRGGFRLGAGGECEPRGARDRRGAAGSAPPVQNVSSSM
jgi:hypothetical protein